MKNTFVKFGAIAGLTLASGFSANATILTVFDGIADGVASFDSTVAAAGESVTVDIWDTISGGVSIDRGDYVITQNDGGFGSVSGYGTMSGRVIGINPSGGGSTPRTDPMDYFGSGITFTFDSPVNAVGFEVGDWATCCTSPTTDLFISFDGGTPIMVASASSTAEGRFPSQVNPSASVFEIFVAAFDDSDEFTTVSFWGNGIGEALYAGGQLRYALLGQSSLPPTTSVPAPATLGMLALSLVALRRFRRS